MRKLIAAGVVLSISQVTSAFAADVIVDPVITPAPPISHDWSGCYIGAHGGWGFANMSGTYDSAQNPPGTPTNLGALDPSGGLVGGQVGCRQQYNNWVLGVELDATATFFDDNIFSNEVLPDPLDVDIDFLGSLRATAGVTAPMMGKDVLFFATGGIAYAHYSFSATNSSNGVPGEQSFDDFGGVIGAGAEMAVTTNVSFGVQYLHYFFGGSDAITNPPINDADAGDNLSLDNTGQVRAFINFNF